MHNFLTLYGFELKKILKRKIVLYTLTLLVFTVIYQILWPPLTSSHTWVDGEGNATTMSHLAYLMDQKEKTKALNGRAVDDALIDEVRDAYKNVYRQEYQMTSGDGYRTITQTELSEMEGVSEEESMTEEDMAAALRKQEAYQPIYGYIHGLAGFYDAVHTIDADSLYQARLDNIIKPHWDNLVLTEGEKTYWTERENELEKPFIYGHAEGWDRILDDFIYLNLMLVLGIAICLSNIFSEEYLRKTDQLILCSRHGKSRLFFAKATAGMTFGIICSVLLFVAAVVSSVCLYGAEGGSVVIQICRPLCSRSLTMGQAVFLLGGMYVIAGIVYSLLTMFLSETVKSGIAVMGMMTGGMLLTMLIDVPYQHRVASQLHALLPTVLVQAERLSDDRLLSIFELHLTNYQTALILYVVVSILLIWKGNRIWQKLKN